MRGFDSLPPFLEPEDIRACLHYAYKLRGPRADRRVPGGVRRVKMLFDTCIAGQAAEVVRQAGHDVVWAGDWSPDPGDE